MRSIPFPLILILLLGGIAWTAWRFWRILPFPVWGKNLAVGAYILCFLVIFPHFLLEEKMPMWLATATYETGTSWIIFFIYAVLLFLLLSLGRLLHLVPASFLKDSLAGSCTVLGILAVLLVCGNLNYRHKYRKTIDIRTEKPLDRPLRIVLASDLHAGYHNRAGELSRWVDMINAEQPDLVLFGGDLIDGSLRPLREGRCDEVLRRIEAPVYACLGNHEYISGREGAESFYARSGIHLLKDSSVTVFGIRIAGRDDRSNPQRVPLSRIAPADSLFTLLLDHQPYRLEEAEAAGIDFQFSGHTHHGQVWPGSWLTDLMYEKAYGEHRRGSTRYYISSGLGIWGGKFRIGTRSEYLVLTVHG
ncbi:MAG: metallophosphoesterase [Bacteroidales bacterium]|nr:metallophosphoesterase [Bacteroidales bacterium]